MLLGTERAVQVRKARSEVRAKVLLESIFSFVPGEISSSSGGRRYLRRGKDDSGIRFSNILGF
jgi:hypothetical protein